MWTLDEPLIFLYDSILHKYGIYSLASMLDTNIQLEPILDYIVKNHTHIIQYSGDAWSKRLFRPFWELYRTIVLMFTEAPFISAFIVGIPVSIVSVICYCLCCVSNDNLPTKYNSFKKKRKNGHIIEQDDAEQQSIGDEDDEEYEERIIQIEPKFIESFVKPANARNIPTWPLMTDDTQKSLAEKKQD